MRLAAPLRLLLAVVCCSIIAATLPAQIRNDNGEPAAPSALSDLARRVIHIEGYRPTPGDVYTLVINYGGSPTAGRANVTESIPLLLHADYRLEAPYLGTIDVRNLSYDQLRQQVTSRLKERLLAPYVGLTLTAPAVYEVFVWGGVSAPGYHTVTSLSRLSDAVAAAGGVQAIGSQRTVEVHRQTGATRYDLVSHLTEGDRAQNPFIRPGERVYVPVAQSVAELRGAVVRPGRYEVLAGETIADIVALAGGLLPTARLDRTSVTRLNAQNRYEILPLAPTEVEALPLASGDIVTIPATTASTETVLLEGAVNRTPATEGTARAVPLEPMLLEVPYTPGMTVLRVLELFGGPTIFADTDRSFIIRGGTGIREPLPDLGTVWEERRWDRDVALEPGDRLVVPMKRLLVTVTGEVNAPRSFAFTSGYVVGDYLQLAGGLHPSYGSPNRLFFAEVDGRLTPVTVDTPVPVGATIYAARNAWGWTRNAFDTVFTVTGWVTGIIGVTTTIITFIQFLSGN